MTEKFNFFKSHKGNKEKEINDMDIKKPLTYNELFNLYNKYRIKNYFDLNAKIKSSVMNRCYELFEKMQVGQGSDLVKNIINLDKLVVNENDQLLDFEFNLKNRY